MSHAFVKSTIILTIATFVSKVLGSVFQIPLQNIAGDEVLGIFKLVYPVYMIALILSVAGIPLAISKLISEARANDNKEDIRNIFITSSILGVAFGLISFGLMAGFSKQIALALGSELAQPSVLIVSITLLIAPYMAVYRGFFQGHEDMRQTAISQVLEQFVRVGLIIAAAYILVMQQADTATVAGSVMIGSSIGAICSLIYLRWKFIKSEARPKVLKSFSWHIFKKWSKRILFLSLPIAVGTINMALLNLVDSLTIPHALERGGFMEVEELYGIYARGLSLVQIAVVFSSAVILPLIPLITKTMAKNDLTETNHYIVRSLKLAHLVSWPAAIGLLALTIPINLTLFTDFQGNDVVAIVNFSSLFTSLAVLTTGILQGLDRSKLAAYIIVGGAVLKAVLNMWLVEINGIVGAAWSTLWIYLLITIFNMILIYQKTRFPLHLKQTVALAVASIGMGIAISFPMYFFEVMSWSRLNGFVYLLFMIPLGALVYAVLVVVMKGLSKDELKSLPIVGSRLNRLYERN